MDTFLAAAAIVVGLVVLEAGAERFTSAIAAFARRLRAAGRHGRPAHRGRRVEELVVVLLAVVSGHPGVAVGNVIGACLANLIGSMPLGMLARRPRVPDRGARIYGLVMIAVTASPPPSPSMAE